MTPRSLFSIMLKILGIFFIKDVIAVLPQIISVTWLLFTDGSSGSEIWNFFLIFLLSGLYIGISYVLVFRTHTVISKLKLDEGFDEETFALTISRASVIHIALIVTGVFVLINEVPDFGRLLYAYINGQQNSYFDNIIPGVPALVFSVIKILAALLLLGERKRIVAFIFRQQSGPELPADDGQEDIL